MTSGSPSNNLNAGSGPTVTDVLVVGTGLAGLTAALKIADFAKVLMVAKASATETNTDWAQGGVATVSNPEIAQDVDQDDSLESHVTDTLSAGAGLCRESVVRMVVEQGPERLQDLLNWGVRFEGSLHREAGHSHRRIFHVQDHTGQAIQRKLIERARCHPNIKILEHHHVIDLITNRRVDPGGIGEPQVLGSYVFDSARDRVFTILAEATVLATGGAGKTYLYTSNWAGATGDGIALAFRAGGRVANLEFMQFHPTCLYHPLARNFLITEAIRGEGAELVNRAGEPFMRKQNPAGSLAPRDIVARGIDAEMKRSGEPCVYLDATPRLVKDFEQKFPVIYKKCLDLGINPNAKPIPVVPAAHYLCGGVIVDERGRTDLKGLYAVGETTCTGLHGANRLASNSLLECLVYGNNAAEDIRVQMSSRLNESSISSWSSRVPDWVATARRDSDEMVVISHMWDEIRRLMWNYVGIVRSNKRLERARSRLQTIQQEVREYYWDLKLHPDILELRNIALVAKLTVECALSRHESRGIHYNLDFPHSAGIARDTVLFPQGNLGVSI